jgi:hypothetical protein
MTSMPVDGQLQSYDPRDMSASKAVYGTWARQTALSMSAGDLREVFLNIATVKVCIRLQHVGLQRNFLTAIQHLFIDPCKPDYVIDVWESKFTGCSFPRFEYDATAVELRGEIPKYSGDGVNFAYYAHARMVHILNENERHGVVAIMDVTRMPDFELACPFRGIFSWILRNNKKAMIHSAAVADAHGDAHLIVGRSGAGKSTTAISCFLSGMKYMGDDLCAVGLADGQVEIYSIYSSGKTYRSEWKFLPQLSDLALPSTDSASQKEIYFFGAQQDRICTSGRLTSIWAPVRSAAEEAPLVCPSITSLIGSMVDSTREILPDAGFESLGLLYAAFKQASVKPLRLRLDRSCPI